MGTYNDFDLETLRGYGLKYRDAIMGRLRADNILNDSDKQLERSLSPCVCGNWLVPVAKQLRADGVNLLADVPGVTVPESPRT